MGNQPMARQAIWMMWENAVGRIMGMTSEYTLEAGMCKVMVKKHSGDDIVCEDGTRIRKGDRVGELHLNNRMVLELTRQAGPNRAALRTARLARDSLQRISEEWEIRPEMAEMKALVGVTLLHRGLTHGLGFEQRRLPSRRFEWLCSFYLKLLLRFMHPDGTERIGRSKEKLTPLLLVCSRDNLRNRFVFRKSSESSRGVPYSSCL